MQEVYYKTDNKLYYCPLVKLKSLYINSYEYLQIG
jgi:hypothetical protein